MFTSGMDGCPDGYIQKRENGLWRGRLPVDNRRVMAEKTVLHKKEQQTVSRRLLFLAPFFLANTVFVMAHWFAPTPTAMVGFWQQVVGTLLGLLGLPAVYAILWKNCLDKRLEVTNGRLVGLHGLANHQLADLVEITGDAGSEKDDFRDSIILRFANDDEISLYVEDYEEKELLSFLAHLKKERPDVPCTYSDIISLESRGLLRFLVSSVEPDNVVLKLSKSPFEDTVMRLLKSHESIFWRIYSCMWMAAVFGLAAFSILIENERSTGVSVWDPSRVVHDLQAVVSHSGGHPGFWDNLNLQAWVTYKAAFDYFMASGVDFMRVVWLLIGVLVVAIPIIRLLSPTFLFVDGNSLGSGTRFVPWDRASAVSLNHGSGSVDSLEDGTLTIESTAQSPLEIDLRRVTDEKQRHLLLRLVDNYAGNAKRNAEFMRTTNTLVDLQFTDIWLDQLEASGGTDVPKPVPDETGERTLAAGKYQVLRALGFGGQGTAYLGRSVEPLTVSGDDTEEAKETAAAPSRDVVVKELVLPNYADVRVLQDATARFERGATLLESLRHPQIVRLWDHFVEDGRAFLVLEYIEGKNLRQVIQEAGAFSLKQVCEFGMQLCEILNYLHSQQPAVIHCDFAPDNLILTPGGKLKLVDFDVAQVLDARAYSFVAGRPSYTPPEQFRGQPTTQSDVFALGGILHFLLNGADPSPLGASAEGPDVQTDFEQLIGECLAFEASERPQSAEDVRVRLQAIAAGSNAGSKTNNTASDGMPGEDDDGVIIKLAQREPSEVVVEG